MLKKKRTAAFKCFPKTYFIYHIWSLLHNVSKSVRKNFGFLARNLWKKRSGT